MYINTDTDKTIDRNEAFLVAVEYDGNIIGNKVDEMLDQIEKEGKTVFIGWALNTKAEQFIYFMPVTEEEYREAKTFKTEDGTYSFFDLMADNSGDEELWDWALKAKVGDTTEGQHYVITRVE